MAVADSGNREISYSGVRGDERMAILDAPERSLHVPTPLILAPHPANWTAAENFHGGAAHTVVQHHGWLGVAERYGVIVVAPETVGRANALTSLGYEGTLQDSMAAIDAVKELGYRVDPERVYACGLSMGGQEALLLLARNPGVFAAGVAFNPVVDLIAWHEDFCASPYYAEMAGEDPKLDALFRIEIGGTPLEVPDAYRARSPIAYAEQLAKLPLLLYWSHLDDIVPNQATSQTVALYNAIKAIDPLAPVAEFNHTWSHGYTLFDFQERWALHEYNDYDMAARWLLTHHRRAFA
jgi:dipeptidyl aminopeptidase/acylaminoacyl peptidase